MGAAQLERALTSVGIATNSNSQAARQRYAALAFRTSGITAQDVNTIAGEMAMAATSGLNDPAKLNDAFTRIAKAADVLWMSPKHINPIQSVQQMSTLAHLFGVYSGAPLQHMIDRSAQMMFVQPEALSKLVTQGTAFIGSAHAAGVSEEDIFKQAMTMGQTGFLSGRGGSGIARVIEYLSGAATMTGHLSKLQHKINVRSRAAHFSRWDTAFAISRRSRKPVAAEGRRPSRSHPQELYLRSTSALGPTV